MQITVNGNPTALEQEATVPQLLATLGLQDKPCAVEVNAVVVPKSAHASCTLRPGDAVEIVTLVGGG
jgi:thiamine biosynthesis protein ThiS